MAASISVPSAIHGRTDTTEHPCARKNVKFRKWKMKFSASLVPEKSEAGQ